MGMAWEEWPESGSDQSLWWERHGNPRIFEKNPPVTKQWVQNGEPLVTD